ncbi:S1 family peptidase [Enterovibrio sp. 27052020O]|uniref:S1 family peptidase n=1 Tax=Enterovibrio sp. 27052020O TaxID=3241166 RepID=UPI00388F1691
MKTWQRKAAFVFLTLSAAGSVFAENTKDPRIIGGDYASIASTPWQAFLDIGNDVKGYFACGGIIISESYVLTAAHCVDGFSTRDVRVFAGFEEISFAGTGIAVANISVYEDYDNEMFTGDIALVRLAAGLPPNAQPIKILPPGRQDELDQEFVGAAQDNLYISGWGATATGGRITEALLKTTMNGVDDNTCSWTNVSGADSGELSAAYVCADKSYTAGICSGDSGGPLVWQDKDYAGDADRGYRAVGIVSFSSSLYGCGSTSSEDGFTQISTYFDWISKNMIGGYQSPSPSFSEDIFDLSSRYNPFDNPPVEPQYPSDDNVVPPVSGGGGGGALHWLVVLFLSVFALRRRLHIS